MSVHEEEIIKIDSESASKEKILDYGVSFRCDLEDYKKILALSKKYDVKISDLLREMMKFCIYWETLVQEEDFPKD